MKNNIVLIGHPYSGKTTIGRELAKQLNYSFIDCDDLIIEHEHDSIANIVKNKGIDYFRQIESRIIKSINCSNTVIATGGGVVLDDKNMKHLLSLSLIIINLSRPLSLINGVNPDRPLTGNINKIANIIKDRNNLYKKYANLNIDNKGTIEDTVKQIIDSKQFKNNK